MSDQQKLLCKLINSCIFMIQFQRIKVQQRKKKFSDIQSKILTKKFVKNILYFNKMRMNYQTRFKMTMAKTTNMIGVSVHEKSKKNA